jgi:hypothetical protein
MDTVCQNCSLCISTEFLSAQEKIDDFYFKLMADVIDNSVPDLVSERDCHLVLCLLIWCCACLPVALFPSQAQHLGFRATLVLGLDLTA